MSPIAARGFNPPDPEFHRLSVADAFRKIGSRQEGLLPMEAAERLRIYGPNRVERVTKAPTASVTPLGLGVESSSGRDIMKIFPRPPRRPLMDLPLALRSCIFPGMMEDVGPWLRDLKRAVLDDAPGATPIHALRRVGGRVTPATLPFEALREVAQTVPGQRFAYIVDVRNHEENASRIEHLAFGADVLFIECRFLEADAVHAAQRNHLTAWQAGLLARRARVARLVPCHFSPRYGGRSAALSKEAERAFRGSDARDEIDTDLPSAT